MVGDVEQAMEIQTLRLADIIAAINTTLPKSRKLVPGNILEIYTDDDGMLVVNELLNELTDPPEYVSCEHGEQVHKYKTEIRKRRIRITAEEIL